MHREDDVVVNSMRGEIDTLCLRRQHCRVETEYTNDHVNKEEEEAVLL